MLEDILQNCTEKQRKAIEAWPLENLPTYSRRNFLRSIDYTLRSCARGRLYFTETRKRPSQEWFQGYKSKITRFIKHIHEGLGKITQFDDAVKHKIVQLYALETKEERDIESSGSDLPWTIIYNLENFSNEGIDVSRVLGLQIKNKQRVRGRDVNFYDMQDLIIKGGIERAEYVREVLDKFRRKQHSEERRLFRHANGIINSGVDLQDFCSFYINYVTSTSEKEEGSSKYYTKYHLLKSAPEILKAGGMDLMKQSVAGMDWMTWKNVSALWFPKVPEFHKKGILEQKKKTLKELSKRKGGADYKLWDAKVTRKLQHIEDDIKLFVSFEKADWNGKSIISALNNTCKYLLGKTNPVEGLGELVGFRNKYKYRTEGLTPSRTVRIMQMHDLLGEGTDTIKEDIRDSTKLVVELPDIYELLIEEIPKKEALDAVRYLRQNYTKTGYVGAKDIADLVLLYRENKWGLSLLKKDTQSLGRNLFNLSWIYEKLKKTALEEKAKTIVNHLRKKHSRTLMTQAKNVIEHEEFENFTKKIPENTGKRDIVNIVRAYSTSLKSAESHNIDHRFDNKIKRMKYGLSVQDIIQQLSIRKLISSRYRAFAGTSKIPEEYTKVVDQCMGAQRRLDKREYQTLSSLISTYLKDGSLGTYKKARELDGNAQIFESQEERIKRFRNMPERIYEIKRKGKKTLRDVINDELRQIQAIIKPLGIRVRNVSDINLDKIPERYYEEIEIHMNNIKNAEFRNADISSVTFYFGNDFIENLQMGGFFGSCLSIDSFNFRYALQHSVDVNKGVIYGKNQKGNIIARNRIALADEGILLTRFYNQDNVEEQWKMYLQDIADATQEIIFTTDYMVNGYDKKKITLTIQDARFKNFYGDGLFVEYKNGVSKVRNQFYYIVPK